MLVRNIALARWEKVMLVRNIALARWEKVMLVRNIEVYTNLEVCSFLNGLWKYYQRSSVGVT